MALDDYTNRGRHLSDDDPMEDQPLELDDNYTALDDDDTGEFVDDEDEEEEKDLPPTMRITDGEEEEEEEPKDADKEGFGAEDER